MKKSLLAFVIAAAPFCVFAQLPSYLPTDGLVGWWPFNGNTNDESGNGNNGTNNGATLTNDRNGITNKAYSFTGESDYIAMPSGSSSSLNITSNISVSMWYKCVPHPGPMMTFQDNVSDNAAGYGFTCGVASVDKISFYCHGWYELTANNQTDNNWHQVCATLSGSNLTLYLDGVVSNTYTGVTAPLSWSYLRTLGVANNPTGGLLLNSLYYSGVLDDIAVWSRALTQQEITALFTGVPTDNNGDGNTTTTTVPAGISYQAVARNAQGQPLSDAAVQVRFTLLTDSLTGAAEYSESHSLTTNSLGLFTTAFGAGTPLSGTFAGINWAEGRKYLNVELDAGNGFVDMGTQQLLSVPYSMRSNTSAKAGTIENTGLPVYANNAAALAGGLLAGQMYRTATGDLKIVY